jgi:hypothetical protein
MKQLKLQSTASVRSHCGLPLCQPRERFFYQNAKPPPVLSNIVLVKIDLTSKAVETYKRLNQPAAFRSLQYYCLSPERRKLIN